MVMLLLGASSRWEETSQTGAGEDKIAKQRHQL
jgi:hypothetical protein